MLIRYLYIINNLTLQYISSLYSYYNMEFYSSVIDTEKTIFISKCMYQKILNYI